jgi:hypothetical protein
VPGAAVGERAIMERIRCGNATTLEPGGNRPRSSARYACSEVALTVHSGTQR